MEKQYKYNDTITFKIGTEEIEYRVSNCYLTATASKHNNDYIFDRLNITDKEEFCEAAYGYKPESDCIFPECEVDDYDALNRVIEALQKECDEYNKKHTNLYKNNDIIIFEVNKKRLTYYVFDKWLSYSEGNNAQIFKELGMNAKEAVDFCSEIYGYLPEHVDANFNNFPEYHYKDFVAANRIIKALQKKCEKANASSEKETAVILPKFKIGDKVRILPRNGNAEDYPETYTNEMCMFAGMECVIESIKNIAEHNHQVTRKYYEEPYVYNVNINKWDWCSAELELVSELAALKSTDYIDAVGFSRQFIKTGGSDYDVDKIKQIKSIDTDEKEIILTINKNRKTF